MRSTLKRLVPNTLDGVTPWIRWIARIWGGLVVAVALLYLVGSAWSWVTTGEVDPHAAEAYPPIENVPPLLMGVGALGLGIAWRWERVGGAITVISQLLALPVLLIHWPISEGFPRYLLAPYGVALAIGIPGALFLVHALAYDGAGAREETRG
jgi:hypothetical protein